MTKKARILCVGSVGKDIFMPTDAGTFIKGKKELEHQWGFYFGDKIHIKDRFYALGGCACNVSVGLARLGFDVTAWGVVGHDADGAWIKEELLREGVDIEHLSTTTTCSSDISFVLVHSKKGERIIFVNRDAGEQLLLDKYEIKWYDWIYAGSFYGEHCAHNMQVLHDASCKKTALIYNPGMANIKKHTRLVYDLLHHSKIVFFNKKEAQEIIRGGEHPPDNLDTLSEVQLLETIAQQASHAHALVLTYGHHGAWAYTKDAIYHIKVPQNHIIDTTGAGDAFASGFVGAILNGCEIDVALRWGTYNSQNVLHYYGGQKGLLEEKTIEKNLPTYEVKKVV